MQPVLQEKLSLTDETPIRLALYFHHVHMMFTYLLIVTEIRRCIRLLSYPNIYFVFPCFMKQSKEILCGLAKEQNFFKAALEKFRKRLELEFVRLPYLLTTTRLFWVEERKKAL